MSSVERTADSIHLVCVFNSLSATSILEERIASHLHSFLITSLVSVSRPSQFNLGQQSRYFLNKRLVGLQRRPGYFGEEKNLSSGSETHTHTHTHTHIYIYIYTHTHTHIYIYIHTHTHIYIYIYIHTHTHTHTHIHTQSYHNNGPDTAYIYVCVRGRIMTAYVNVYPKRVRTAILGQSVLKCDHT